MMAPNIWENVMSGASVMETALRNDVRDCERRVREATPKPVISKGRLIYRGSNAALEVAERDLAAAQRRLENWLSERGL